MLKIKRVLAREILDSRGNPTVETEIELESGLVATAAVPSGASTGSFEALELRDGDPQRYRGLGVLKAVENVNTHIQKAMIGMDVHNQREIDEKIIALDGTENKSKLGANAILSVSLAAARAGSLAVDAPLYQYLANIFEFPKNFHLPTPMFNVINGGQHSDSGLSIQEYKIVPGGIKTFKEQYRAGSEVFHNLKKILSQKGFSVGVGDEGGFAPHLQNNAEPLKYINEAIEEAGYQPGRQISIGIDAAASSFFDKKIGKYVLMPENAEFSPEKIIEEYERWIGKYHVISVEDGLNENDWDGWSKMNEKIGAQVMLIGDDLLVTNVKRLREAIDKKACNAVLIKVNQIGSLSETVDCIKMAQENDIKIVISHRSGETTDDFIADLAVGAGAEFIKSGSLSRGERICKYNRLLRIEEELNR